ncbi:beta-glucosidase BglX [Kushneria phosphatilytica]|uniref:beta-glucosidase n=1 Tax=Kushneria phosphatilytica TaxID=657387 RepID=A0A1S1NSG9_9GAMM|nr:beta-glucosidase BglX [Kushneria phosphatilytica]OHV08032.1 glycosyl hydrolase [Kushneria phosphatilytica]QEL09943.1 beta-glucosidase BglX [Kushneria phosphatilytica]
MTRPHYAPAIAPQPTALPFELSPIRYRELTAQVESLLERMTLEEKIGQMTQFTSNRDTTGPSVGSDIEQDIRAGRVGSVFNAFDADFTRELQQLAVDNSRLGIPLLFGYDIIHGFRTIFPIPLGQAASWNLDGIERAAHIAATEGAAAGVHWSFTPMLDISRDPRWGRVMEGPGEDPWLASQIATAQVRGLQGHDPEATDTLAACAKHFAGYGAVEAGREYNTVDMSQWRLRSVYLPPFKAALDAGCATVMTAFNSLNGLPATADPLLFERILRDEWQFQGFVVTDYTAIMELERHGVADGARQAAKKAVNAGVDMDMQDGYYLDELGGLVESGEVAEARIDQAVRRILLVKAALGLLEDPYRYSDRERERTSILTDAHRQAARELARESMVLLKNDEQVLPLSKDISTLAVIGPLGNTQEVIGSWHADGDAEQAISLMTGLRNRLGDGVELLQAEGASNEIGSTDTSGIDEAVRLAEQADAVILALGERQEYADEAASRADIRLPGMQLELARRVIEAVGDKPVATVLFNGRPLELTDLEAIAPAMLEAWWPGSEAGNAVADVLFGDYNPSGKLTMTFPRSVGQVPLYYNHFNTGRPKGVDPKYASQYLDIPNTPLYPFGFGLSYTEFEYSRLDLDRPSISGEQALSIRVTLTNSGERRGTEVAQLYLRDLTASVVRPVRELKDFQRVTLEPGESRTLTFWITRDQLAFLDAELAMRVQPGRFEVQIGSSSEAGQTAEFVLEE